MHPEPKSSYRLISIKQMGIHNDLAQTAMLANVL